MMTNKFYSTLFLILTLSIPAQTFAVATPTYLESLLTLVGPYAGNAAKIGKEAFTLFLREVISEKIAKTVLANPDKKPSQKELEKLSKVLIKNHGQVDNLIKKANARRALTETLIAQHQAHPTQKVLPA